VYSIYLHTALRYDVEFQITECKVVERHIVENQVVEQPICQTNKLQKMQIVELISYRTYILLNIQQNVELIGLLFLVTILPLGAYLG
jgi:hypothetical protein